MQHNEYTVDAESIDWSLYALKSMAYERARQNVEYVRVSSS